jgi:hypothetical protein
MTKFILLALHTHYSMMSWNKKSSQLRPPNQMILSM